MPRSFKIWVSIALAGLARAHMGAFHKGMYCINGSDPNVVNRNANSPCLPLYNLTYNDYWMHGYDGCNNLPPDKGDFLELPAGGDFTVELADNRACTSINPEAILTPWGDGQNHPDDYSGTDDHCITAPNLHTQNETMAAGTAFAISYESDIKKVTLDNLVVFTVRYYTPWKRITTYDVPSGMPACPEEGCICTFVWIPNGCGISNMYMFPYKCKVIPDNTAPKTLAVPKAPVWCEDDESKCIEGAKQIMIWHQLDGNNIEVEGYDKYGKPKSPGYNMKCGFHDGAQNDIFVDSGAGSGTGPAQTGGGATPAISAAATTPPSTSTSTSSSSTTSSTTSSSSTYSHATTTSAPPGHCTNTPDGGLGHRARARHARTRRERQALF